MGKFYVYISLDKKKYKVCREDIREVFSLKKTRLPIAPSYASHSDKEDQQTSLDSSSSEV